MAPPRIFFRGNKFRIILRQLSVFQRDVEKDVTKFNQGTLTRLQNELVAIGRNEFRAMAAAFIETAKITDDKIKEFILLLRDRYLGLWVQNITKAFATASDSIEGSQNKLNRNRTILQRIFTALFGRDEGAKRLAESQLKGNMSGVVRTRQTAGGQRTIFRMGITQHVKMLVKTLPSNFFREADSILLKQRDRLRKVPRAKRLFRISNPGAVPESSQTCIFVQGKVLTADALMFVQRELSPNLFHPNCRHHILRSFKETLDTYDGRYGPVLTLKDVQRFTSHKKIRRRSRPNPHAISV